MASIKQINGKYRASIRKKGNELSASFNDRETAQLWAFYKENLIDEIENFNVALHDMITLDCAIECKENDLREQRKDKKTIQDISNLRDWFKEFIPLPLNEITYELIHKKINKMKNSIVFIGGNKNTGTGKKQQISFVTLCKRLSCLSTVLNLMIDNGIQIENQAYKYLCYFRNKTNENENV